MRDAFGWDVERYLRFGGYPGAAPLADAPERWTRYVLDALVETTVSRDVLLLHRVEKPVLLRRLFELGCMYSGQVLSYTKMLGQLHDAGNTVLSIIGARTKDRLFWEDEIAQASDELIVCTDDGSYGRRALVTEPLQELLERRSGEIARVWAVGPAAMMKFVAATTKPFGVHTIVSLNNIMIDGTGMCGGCRVQLEDGAQFACVDGPEFDAHKVDWYTLLARQRSYLEEEAQAVERWKHRCRLEDK